MRHPPLGGAAEVGQGALDPGAREALVGVVYAGIAGATGSESPLALPFIGDGFTPVANVLGLLFFAGATWLLYGFARKITRNSDRESAAK